VVAAPITTPSAAAAVMAASPPPVPRLAPDQIAIAVRTHTEDGRAIDGMCVAVQPPMWPWGQPIGEGVTDGNGWFVAVYRFDPSMDPGMGQAGARAWDCTQRDPGYGGRDFTPVAGLEQGRTSVVDLVAPVGGVALGTIRDQSGRPVGGVCVYEAASNISKQSTRTDENGRFRFARLPRSAGVLNVGHCAVQEGGTFTSAYRDLVFAATQDVDIMVAPPSWDRVENTSWITSVWTRGFDTYSALSDPLDPQPSCMAARPTRTIWQGAGVAPNGAKVSGVADGRVVVAAFEQISRPYPERPLVGREIGCGPLSAAGFTVSSSGSTFLMVATSGSWGGEGTLTWTPIG
jgi:hypothetical protein